MHIIPSHIGIIYVLNEMRQPSVQYMNSLSSVLTNGLSINYNIIYLYLFTSCSIGSFSVITISVYLNYYIIWVGQILNWLFFISSRSV